MTLDNSCPKCGSTRIIPRARVVDRGHFNQEVRDLTLVVYVKPDALLFKQPHREALHARVCGDCGFTELYLDGARDFYESYEASIRTGLNR